jgi:hypothetical protein
MVPAACAVDDFEGVIDTFELNNESEGDIIS